MSEVNPANILQVGLGFWASKCLLTAVDFGLFTTLARSPMTGAQLERELELHPRATFDFLDALLALGFLAREGGGPEAVYSNTEETRVFLGREPPRYVGGMLEMANTRLFGYWDDLGEALRSGKPQNEVKHVGKSVFEAIYADPGSLEGSVDAMSGISMGNFNAFAQTFDFGPYESMCDVGGATGQLSILCARHNAHLTVTSFDLPAVQPIAQKTIAGAGLSDRISTIAGDFFAGPFPKADLITMGMILHDWNLKKKMHLIRAAYDALPPPAAPSP